MSKPSRVTAKDLAFERERLTWRRKLRAEQENHDKTKEQIRELERRLEEKDDLLRSKDDWIERLLEYTELDRDDIAKVVEKQKRAPAHDPVISNIVSSLARSVMAVMPDMDDIPPNRMTMHIADGIDLPIHIDRDKNTGVVRLTVGVEDNDGSEVRELLTLQPYARKGTGGVTLRVYADVTQTDPTETLDIPVYTYKHNKAR